MFVHCIQFISIINVLVVLSLSIFFLFFFCARTFTFLFILCFVLLETFQHSVHSFFFW